MTRFTQQGVERMKAPPKPKRSTRSIPITRGLALALRISYSGSKTWRALYYVNGKPRTETLGKFPAVSVAEAYKKARSSSPRAPPRRRRLAPSATWLRTSSPTMSRSRT